MNSKDPRLNDANIYIQEAIRMLETAQIEHHLDHTNVSNVGAALEGLDIIQRSIGGPHRCDHLKVAARLQQVANELRSCREPCVLTAHADIETAAELFLAVIDRVNVS